ncbi:glycine cleavage system aminomethyltransferase T [Microbacterium trichothecenolyticum]|uniref:glycine cleavage T C-terminal barrel domain-containing protein n=1 Tax=Microbacterium trichothecenolyticum TaxID=69370 RepID=UPI002855B4FA|nr:glycine cleavage T C-terminal barrel domain-containing protein [Microbacterium trichothecenolyticum]MDR7184348.1 glycine cleavage system aminomethyltransferase T [Microbacterium trichothecenolyticum]
MPHPPADQRERYDRLKADPRGAFDRERPAIFSPAAAAQDEGNGRTTVKRFGPLYLPSEYTGWSEEAAAHVESAYLGDWSSLAKVHVRGPEALSFLGWLGMNDLSRFELGQVKHHVQLDEHGRVASEGILLRLGDDEFLYTAGSGDWLLWQLSQGEWDATADDISPELFIFGVQGPRSIHVLERVLGASLRDLRFNRSRPARLGGTDVRVLRTGISGELGYEVHGPADAADQVWRAIRDAGADDGLKQLGLRAQPVQHIEAGIATNGLDYFPAAAITPGAPWQFTQGGIEGSFVPTGGFADYFRKPVELGWQVRGDFTHDFLGKDALLADLAAGEPARVLAGLIWNAGDVASVLTAFLDDGPLPEPMELPRVAGPAFDTVLKDGAVVGVATGRTVSPTLRRMISLVTIAREHSAPGTEVVVVWGRPGTPQREIRATVAALPFKPDNRRVDVSQL